MICPINRVVHPNKCMWQRANGLFDSPYVCGTTKRNLSLFHQILIAIPTSLRNNKNIHKQKKDDYILFPFSEIFITSFFLFSISFLFIIKECLKEFRYCASGLGCSKIINFCCTEAGFTTKWGRISSIGDIRISLGTSYNVVRRRTTE